MVASQELIRLETQTAASPLPGSGPKRQRRRRGIKRRRKILCAFFVWVESKMGMSRLPVFVYLLQNKAEYFYIGMVAFTQRSRCDLLGYDAVYSGW